MAKRRLQPKDIEKLENTSAAMAFLDVGGVVGGGEAEAPCPTSCGEGGSECTSCTNCSCCSTCSDCTGCSQCTGCSDCTQTSVSIARCCGNSLSGCPDPCKTLNCGDALLKLVENVNVEDDVVEGAAKE